MKKLTAPTMSRPVPVSPAPCLSGGALVGRPVLILSRAFVAPLALALGATLLLACPGVQAAVGKPVAKAKGPAPAVTNAPAAEVPIPASVFAIPASSKEGRNPFFPRSMASTAKQTQPSAAVEPAALSLTGLNFGPKPTVMVNNRTFEKGEQAEIKLPNGAKVLVKCEDIKSDSAVILVNGERRELRLRAGL